jgi:hypothetical protein
MPRYYFNLVNSTERIADEEGVELGEDAAVPSEALQAVAELIQEEPLREWRDWIMAVTDEDGRVVVSIELGQFTSPRAQS